MTPIPETSANNSNNNNKEKRPARQPRVGGRESELPRALFPVKQTNNKKRRK